MYGLKFPTEEQLKKIPYTPSFGLPPGFNLPKVEDLSASMPPVENQGYQGSCAAFATAYALKSYQEKKQNNWSYFENGVARRDRVCSPSFVFNLVKQMTNNRNCLEGIYFAEAFDVLKTYGTPFWNDFPYTELKCTTFPNQAIIDKASMNKISSYKSVNFKNLDEIKYNLSVGNPVVLGVLLDDFFQPDGFEAFRNGRHYTFIPKNLLNPNNYHAMLCTGYNDQTQSFQVMNSWGSHWGNSGYVDIPYSWFPVVVQESYTMNDAFRSALFVSVQTKETRSDGAIVSPSSYSAWFRQGSYWEYKNIKIGLTYLDIKDSTASVIFTDIDSGKVVNTVTYKINVPQSFYYNDKKITFLFTDITRTGRGPFDQSVFFTVSIDKSIDKDFLDRINNLKFLYIQKELSGKMKDMQEKRSKRDN